jgi:hypothetical protein
MQFHYIRATVHNIGLSAICIYTPLSTFLRSVGPPPLNSAVLPPPPGRHASGGHERAPGGGARLQHLQLHSHRDQLVPIGRANPVLASE